MVGVDEKIDEVVVVQVSDRLWFLLPALTPFGEYSPLALARRFERFFPVFEIFVTLIVFSVQDTE